jgi:DNA polymerase III epsilon subunit-like protein
MSCMQYIAFDFETSGLPTGRRNIEVTHETLKNFDSCRAVSLSAARFSSKGRLIDTFDTIVKPDNFQIGEKSIEIHGITQEKAEHEGRPFVEVFTDFMNFIGPRTTCMVAHNAQFDTSVLRSEMIRNGINLNLIENLNFRCTLELYRERFLKPIRLGVLYNELFGKDFENAHNSLADCIACGKVYPYMIGYTKELKNIGVPKVIIGASSVASAIGINHFKKQPELISELWKKYSPETFEGKTRDEEALIVLNSTGTTKDILTEAENFKSEKSDDVQQQIRKLFHKLEYSGILPQDMLKAKDYIRKTVSTNHGTRNEEKTAKFDNMSTKLMEDDTFYTYDICEIEGTLYQVVGRVDRIQNNEDGSRILVEIKNRTRGLFNTVRDYEEVQCQTYMHMMDGIDYCRLVETYNDESKSYLMQKNTEKWNSVIVPKLQNFCEHFHSMLSENLSV